MVVQDRLEKEKGIAKNAVEAYVYDMRGKLYDELEKFITEEVCITVTNLYVKYVYTTCLSETLHTQKHVKQCHICTAQ